MLSQESQPHLDSLGMAIMYLYQTSQSDPLKVLLALLVDKVAPRYCPAFDDSR